MSSLKVVIDTNVFVSGLFFSGPPYHILKAWQEGRFRMAVSEEIINEYKRVIDTLSVKLGDIDLEVVVERLVIEADMVASYSFEQPVGALLDRLTHHVQIIEIIGDSFRLKSSLGKSEPQEE